MQRPSPPPAPGPATLAGTSSFVRLVRLGRFLLILAILATLATMVGRAVLARSAPASRARMPDTPAAPAVFGAKSLFHQFREGHWTFADTPWRSTVAAVPLGALDRRMQAVPATAAHGAAEGAELIELLRPLFPPPRHRDGVAIYELREPQLRVNMFVRPGSRPVWLGAHAAYPRDDDTWTLITLVAEPARTRALRELEPLLPGLDAAARLCGRWDEGGVLQCEVFRLPAGAADRLPEAWRTGGWQVDARPGAGRPTEWLCVNEKRTVHATLRSRAWLGMETLFLVRVDQVVGADAAHQGADR